MRKVLLNKKQSKTSTNEPMNILVNFDRDVSLFQDEIYTETVDINQVYNDEKDQNTKHRFIVTLYPVCSNSLFNRISEVVYKEGSSDAKIIFNTKKNDIPYTGRISKAIFNRIQTIRNTEYSNKQHQLTYHCGVDIFNNHLLRAIDKVSVQKRAVGAKTGCTVYSGDTTTIIEQTDGFNTIGDYKRTSSGDNIKIEYPNSMYSYTYKHAFTGNQALYEKDGIETFFNAYKNTLKKNNGWLGFYNTTAFKTPIKNDIDYSINKCLNNVNHCNFIDLTPERDLFYFTPKKNQYRRRLEYNWDYCLTYPAVSVYNDGSLLIGKGCGLPLHKIDNESYIEIYGNNGIEMLLFKSIVKHNLKPGNNVLLHFSNGKKIKTSVITIGDSKGENKDYFFTIQKADIDNVFTENLTIDRFSKVVSGLECDYYFRKFNKFSKDCKSTINQLAFAKTIYGDDVAQIIFTDDLDIKDYKDNLGRPLTEVYLTILKTNRGYKKWYEENIANDETIEYSHVFGEVTSGLDVPFYVDKEYPTIRKQHNIKVNQIPDNINIEVPETSTKLESDITIEFSSFYGDLVEFNPTAFTETVLEEVFHRFNTAQRETINPEYSTLYYDEIAFDYYDGNNYANKNVTGNTSIRQYELNKGCANLAPEGYLYKPHHKIIIGESSNNVQQLSDTYLIMIEPTTFDKENNTLTLSLDGNFGLALNDTIIIIDNATSKKYFYLVTRSFLDVKTNIYKCVIAPQGNDFISGTDINSKYTFFKHNSSIPDYAYSIPDDTGRYIWRDVLKPSQYNVTSQLYGKPFTNGALYHNINIVFPVKRQDPFYKNNMFIQLENNFEISSTESDFSDFEFISSTPSTLCF